MVDSPDSLAKITGRHICVHSERKNPWIAAFGLELAPLAIQSTFAESTKRLAGVTPGQFGFILRRRSRLRGFVILPSDGSGRALIRIGYAAGRRSD